MLEIDYPIAQVSYPWNWSVKGVEKVPVVCVSPISLSSILVSMTAYKVFQV